MVSRRNVLRRTVYWLKADSRFQARSMQRMLGGARARHTCQIVYLNLSGCAVLEHRSDDQTLRDGDTVIDALHEPRTSISLPLGGFRTLTEFLNIPDRVLPWHLSWMIIDSACEAMVEGEVYRLGPGTVFWLPAGTRNRMHAIRGVPPVTLYHMRIDMSPSPRAGPAGRPMISYNRWDLRPLFEMLYELYLIGGTPWWQQRAKSVLLLLRAGLGDESHTKTAAGLSAVQRHKLLQYARAHAHERMSPADMANHLDLNRDYFSRVFKKTFGQPARTWLVAQRIKTAAIQLIDTRLTVSQIAFALGYRDVYLFSRQFKHVMGMSPKAYRRRYGAGDGG